MQQGEVGLKMFKCDKREMLVKHDLTCTAKGAEIHQTHGRRLMVETTKTLEGIFF